MLSHAWYLEEAFGEKMNLDRSEMKKRYFCILLKSKTSEFHRPGGIFLL